MKQRGMSLVEVLVSVGIIGVLIFAAMTVTGTALTQTRLVRDKQYGTQKAVSILEELKSLVSNASGRTVTVLDQYDDGAQTRPRLTAQGDPDNDPPGDVLSGNVSRPDLPTGWLYARQISIIRLPGQSSIGVRLARVKIFRNEPDGRRLLAEVASVIRTPAGPMPPTQVFDVYSLEIENVPAWWVQMARLAPMVDGAILDLEARNPGLQFRRHRITKLAYGRDREYAPYVNQTADADAVVNSVYWYPGTLTTDTTRNPTLLRYYYNPEGMAARMTRDTATSPGVPSFINGYDVTYDGVGDNPFPYAIADQWNHAMRYEDERALYEARRTAKYPSSAPPALVDKNIYPNEEPTYRLLIEDMFQNPDRYTNAIMINLHGELFPFPPVRNVSDPAKDPETFTVAPLRGLRVVTHPERLTYGNGDTLRLRVYSWITPNDTDLPATTGSDYMTVPITVVIPGMDVSAAVNIDAMIGGTNQDSSSATREPYSQVVNPVFDALQPNKMYKTVTYDPSIPGTVIRLFNTPYRTPCVSAAGALSAGGVCAAADRGLSLNGRLYGMEYVPSPVENLRQNETPFSRNLTGIGTGPKNTARWIISINSGGINTPTYQNRVFRFETRIGNTVNDGAMFPVRDHPTNLSTTYLWRGTDAWLYGNPAAVPPVNPSFPITERYQFQGDPRHSPYIENKAPFTGTVNGIALNIAGLPAYLTTNRIGMGYNRYFDDFFGDTSDFAGANTTVSNAPAAGMTQDTNKWNGWMYSLPLVAPNDYFGINKGHPGDTESDDNWQTDGAPLDLDVNRFYEVTRRMITSSRLLYTTMTGFSYYYIGIGGEIGYDSENGFASSLPVNTKPFSGVSGLGNEQSITSGVKYIRRGNASNFWWGMPWLGELYPDDRYPPAVANGWANTGNLPTGTGVNEFRRVTRDNMFWDNTAANMRPTAGLTMPAGTVFQNTSRRTWGRGSTSLFWTGTPNATFHHEPDDSPNQGYIGALGAQMQNATSGYFFPLFDPITARRPFRLDVDKTAENPPDFLQAPYGPPFTTAYQGRFYADGASPTASGQPASALISLRDPDTNNVGFVVVNGLSPAGDSGTAFVGRWAFLSLVHSYFTSGRYAGAEACGTCPRRTIQVPRVAITTPNAQTPLDNPPNIPIAWQTSWFRWDSQKYTQSYPDGFSETVPLYYAVMYSSDDGATWRYVQDTPDTPADATPGTRLDATDTRRITANNCTLSTPAGSFPEGNYIIRVEAYRDTLQTHYSFHQFRAYVQR